MIRLLQNEFAEASDQLEGDNRTIEISMATGYAAYDYLKEMVERIQEKYPTVTVHLHR